MKVGEIVFTIILLITPLIFYAQAESVFNGIRLNECIEEVTQKLSEISKTIDTISIDSPSFPLSKQTEEHLICSEVKTDNGMIGKVVFTFADNSLKYIEARGGMCGKYLRVRALIRPGFIWIMMSMLPKGYF